MYFIDMIEDIKSNDYKFIFIVKKPWYKTQQQVQNTCKEFLKNFPNYMMSWRDKKHLIIDIYFDVNGFEIDKEINSKNFTIKIY